MTNAIEGLRRHRGRAAHPNIFAMKTWSLIAACKALGRADVAAEGYDRFGEWRRFTARHGPDRCAGGDPHGSKRIADAAGHAKALRLRPFVATAQRGAELVQLLAEDPFRPQAWHKSLVRCTLPGCSERRPSRCARARRPSAHVLTKKSPFLRQ